MHRWTAPRVVGLDRDDTSLRHRVAGIDHQVQDQQFELGRIDHRGPQLGVLPDFDLHPRPERAVQQPVHPRNCGVQIHRTRRQWLAAGKGQ